MATALDVNPRLVHGEKLNPLKVAQAPEQHFKPAEEAKIEE